MPVSRKDFVPYEGLVQRGAQELNRLYKNESEATIKKLVASAVGKTAKVKAGRVIEGLPEVFRSLYSEANMAPAMLPAMKKAALMGASAFNSGDLLTRSMSEFQQVTAGFEEHVRFYADNYVARIVVPSLRKVVADSDPSELKAELAAKAEKLFADSEHYWHNVVHQATSHSYHYGMLKAADNVGYRRLMYMAVLDEVTTDFCRKVDGQVISLTPVLKALVDLSDVSGPSIKGHKPWEKIRKMKNPTPASLIRNKMLLPPFHGNCRTTTHVF